MFPQFIKILFLSSLLFADAFFLGLDTEHLIVALIGVLSGSFILTYYRKGITWTDKCIKILCSSLGGLFGGVAIAKYFNIESMQYFGIIMFVSSFLILIFLRAVLTVTEKNATGIVTAIIQRSFSGVNEDMETKQTKVVTTEATDSEMKAAHNAITKEIIKED